MATKTKNSQDPRQKEQEDQDRPSFLNFELKEHLLAFINSFIEYFETLFLYLRKIAIERAIAGFQAYLLLRVGIFFISIGSLFFLAAFFLFLQRTFEGDPLPASLGTGGLCLALSLTFLLLSARKIRNQW